MPERVVNGSSRERALKVARTRQTSRARALNKKKKRKPKRQQIKPRRETRNQREIHRVIPREGKRVSRIDTMSRIVSFAVRSEVRVRKARIFMVKQTRVSSLLASQGPHIGYICSTP